MHDFDNRKAPAIEEMEGNAVVEREDQGCNVRKEFYKLVKKETKRIVREVFKWMEWQTTGECIWKQENIIWNVKKQLEGQRNINTYLKIMGNSLLVPRKSKISGRIVIFLIY